MRTRLPRSAGKIVTGTGRSVVAGLRSSPANARGLALEAAWIATHLALYPASAFSRQRTKDREPYSLTGLSPLRRSLLVSDPDAAGTPILLLHGLIDNRSIFTRLRRSLHRRGFHRVRSVELPLFISTVEEAAEQLAASVRSAVEHGGGRRVHIVAHSLGGLVARYYIQLLGGDQYVDTLVTLATPHGGTRLAHLVPRAVPYPLVAQLRPGSSLLRDLAAPAPGCTTRFIAVGAQLDSIVRPAEARLDHPDLDVENLTVDGLGHHSLAFSGEVAYLVANCLIRADLRAGEAETDTDTEAGPIAADAADPAASADPADTADPADPPDTATRDSAKSTVRTERSRRVRPAGLIRSSAYRARDGADVL